MSQSAPNKSHPREPDFDDNAAAAESSRDKKDNDIAYWKHRVEPAEGERNAAGQRVHEMEAGGAQTELTATYERVRKLEANAEAKSRETERLKSVI